MNQCKTVRQRTARYRLVHCSALSLCSFYLFHCGNLYFFMLHSFYNVVFFILHHSHVAVVSNLLCRNLFMLNFFSYCTLFMYCTNSCCTFTRSNVSVLDSSPVAYCVALCSCCTISRGVTRSPTDIQDDELCCNN